MGKTLLVVESPAKAKTIKKYLGKDYDVRASVGHIKDLPDGSSRARTSSRRRNPQNDSPIVGVDVNDTFKPQYKIIPGKD